MPAKIHIPPFWTKDIDTGEERLWNSHLDFYNTHNPFNKTLERHRTLVLQMLRKTRGNFSLYRMVMSHDKSLLEERFNKKIESNFAPKRIRNTKKYSNIRIFDPYNAIDYGTFDSVNELSKLVELSPEVIRKRFRNENTTIGNYSYTLNSDIDIIELTNTIRYFDGLESIDKLTEYKGIDNV